MATYFAVVSLMEDLEQLLKFYDLVTASDRVYWDQLCADVFCPFTKEDIEILYKSVCSMDSLLRDSSGESYNHEIITNQISEKLIRNVARKAGNCMDLWAVLCLPDPDRLFSRVIRGDSAERTEAMTDLNFRISEGVDKEKILDDIAVYRPQLKVLLIWGKAGTGKTTLAKYLFDRSQAVYGFEVCVWVTVSGDYQLREILLSKIIKKKELREILIGILLCVTDGSNEIYGKSNEELSQQVYASLVGKRYLIVLDDIGWYPRDWDTSQWDDLKRAIPDNENGCTIILTSRYFPPFSSLDNLKGYELLNLDESSSWNLLSSKVFVNKSHPPGLKPIAATIILACKGLPLTIVVMAGLLSKLELRRDDWLKVERRLIGGGILSKLGMRGNDWKREAAQTVSSLVSHPRIYALSYNYLPAHLKRCFLSMGKFPKGYEISAKTLIWLWVPMGFIRPTMLKSLKEVAEEYLEDLASRGLIIVRRKNSNGRIKTCYIHELIREICSRESKKPKFVHLINPLSYLRDKRKVSLTEIVREIDSINEELKKIPDEKKVEGIKVASSKGISITYLSPSRRTTNAEGKLVGLEKDLITMLDRLTGHPSKLRVFPVIGMAGIGKTTFCKNLYDKPLVVHHFYVRVWITVSQQYQVRELLAGILHCVTNSADEIYGKTNEELKEQVYRSLKGKRYLIVLDDMWDTELWDDLKRTFPDDKNGSRIMFTSRLRDVADHASQSTPHCLRCLSIDESWELLSSKIFGDESCPVDLMEIGKQIAYKCQGLPLAIVVVGGLLSKMNKSVDIWEEVAQSVGSLVMEEAEHCENILALSYNHLPDPLKACFLYMGVFPEDYEISVKKLIWLWVAEGFIRPQMLKSLEEVAEAYLEDLVARSLVMVKRRSSDGRIKTCYIHDLMRELCVRESQKQNFLHVINNCGQLQENNLYDNLCLPFEIQQHLRRLSFHSSIQKYVHRISLPYTRSVLCFEKISFSDPQGYLGLDFKLLKVLDIMNIHLVKIPTDMCFLTYLKFLALTIQNHFNMKSLFVVHSLQTLIVDGEWDGHLHRIFWDMLELRHLHLKRICLPYSQLMEFQSPSTSVSELPDEEVPPRDLSNLQSLSTIRPISCTEKVLVTMPNLKKLGIHEFEEDNRFRGWFKNLVHLQKLEKLKYVFGNPFASSALKPDRLPSWDSFPPKLVKLTLSGTSLPWEDMLKLSVLPKLEVLKLRNYAFSGAVWKSNEGGFLCLKFLLIGSTDLEIWEADGTPFPELEHLVLRHCRYLEEIPYEIVEAPLLENIELHCCKDSAVTSARDLQEVQENLGNDLLKIRVTQG